MVVVSFFSGGFWSGERGMEASGEFFKSMNVVFLVEVIYCMVGGGV